MAKRVFPKWLYVLSLGALSICLSCARGKNPKISFVSQTTAIGLWEPARTGSLEASASTPYSIHWVGPVSIEDIQGQIDCLDEAVRERSAGIILAPDHPLSLITSVRNAIAHGIPTVVISSPLQMNASDLLFYVLNDEEEEGRIAARRIGARLKGKGSVAVLGLNYNASGLIPRMRSFENTLNREFPGIILDSRHLDSSSEAQAEQNAYGLLKDSHSPDAIFALTSTATSGVLRAINEGGLHKRFVLVTCDQDYEALYPLSLGEIDSVIAENTFAMGQQAVELIASERSGGHATKTIYIKPVLVTRENMFSPALLHILTYDQRALY